MCGKWRLFSKNNISRPFHDTGHSLSTHKIPYFIKYSVIDIGCVSCAYIRESIIKFSRLDRKHETQNDSIHRGNFMKLIVLFIRIF